MAKKGRDRGQGPGWGRGGCSDGGSGSGEKTGLVDSEMKYGAAKNKSCSLEEGQISDVDRRFNSEQSDSEEMKANCVSVVEYGNFRVNCVPKQGFACIFSEIALMEEDMIDQNGARFSLGKECENQVG